MSVGLFELSNSLVSDVRQAGTAYRPGHNADLATVTLQVYGINFYHSRKTNATYYSYSLAEAQRAANSHLDTKGR